MELAQEVTFLNKVAIKQTFAHLSENSTLIVDDSNTVYIDYVVLQLIKDFVKFGCKDKNIDVYLIGFRKEYKTENSVNHVTTIVSDYKEKVALHEIKEGIKVLSNILKVKELPKAG